MDGLEKYVIKSNGVAWRVIDDIALLINEEGTKMHMLNKVGSLIWKYADEGITIKDIISNVLQRFDVDGETARRDCLEFIYKLADMKILNIAEKPVEIQL